MGDIGGQEGIKMASASTTSANAPAKDLSLVLTVQLKPVIKAQISGKMVCISTNDVAFTSVHSEKTRLKKVDYDNYYYEKIAITTVFSGCQKLTSAMKLRPEK